MMMAKAESVRHVTRNRKLTDEEKMRCQEVREQVMPEYPPKRCELVRDAIKRLKAIREELGLSLADVQERTGMSRSVLSKLEDEGQGVTVRTLERYARGLGCRLTIDVLRVGDVPAAIHA